MERVCTDATSINLSTVDIAGAVVELDRVIAGSQNRGVDDGGDEADDGLVSMGAWVRLRQLLLQVDEAIHMLPLTQAANSSDRRYTCEGTGFEQLLTAVGIHADNVGSLKEQCMKGVHTLGALSRFGVGSSSTLNLQKFADACMAAFDTARPQSEYKLCVQEIPERLSGRHRTQAADTAQRSPSLPPQLSPSLPPQLSPQLSPSLPPQLSP